MYVAETDVVSLLCQGGGGGLVLKHKIEHRVIMGCPKFEPRPWQQFFSDSTAWQQTLPTEQITGYWLIYCMCVCVFMLYVLHVGAWKSSLLAKGFLTWNKTSNQTNPIKKCIHSAVNHPFASTPWSTRLNIEWLWDVPSLSPGHGSSFSVTALPDNKHCPLNR